MKARWFGGWAGLGALAIAAGVVGFAPAQAEVDVDAVIAQVEMAGYECPPYTTYCRTDRQCDGYCGVPGAGACEWGCCACTM